VFGLKEDNKKNTPLLPTQRPDDYEKVIPFGPSTIENIDVAMIEYMNELQLFATTQKGFEKVPVVWVSPERSLLSKRNQTIRDNSGNLILPIISVERTNLVKDPTRKGTVWGNVLPVKDEKGGTIKIARRLKQDKSSNFANVESYRGYKQINFPGLKNKKIVYETMTIPLPVYVTSTYEITIRTEYQQQMNEILTPFITKPGAINYIILRRSGHKYEGFIQEDFSQSNNFSSFTNEERKLETKIQIEVLGYLIGENKNQDRPKYAIRENAVEIKMPRERIVLQETPERDNGRFYGLAGVVRHKPPTPSDVTTFVFDRNAASSGAATTGGTAGTGAPITVDNYNARGAFVESPNGTLTTFTLSIPMISNTEMIFRDGILMTIGSAYDYTVTNSTTIEFTEAPGANENLTISYVKDN